MELDCAGLLACSEDDERPLKEPKQRSGLFRIVL